MIQFMKILSFFVLMSVLSAVSAAPVVVGNLGSLEFIGTQTSSVLTFGPLNFSDDIDDIYQFTVDTDGLPSSASGAATSLNLQPSFNISGFQYALVDSANNNLSGFVPSGSSAEINLVSNGTYGIWFQGTVDGNVGGIAVGAIALSTTPVPVPAAIWLFGSTLVALFGMRRLT